MSSSSPLQHEISASHQQKPQQPQQPSTSQVSPQQLQQPQQQHQDQLQQYYSQLTPGMYLYLSIILNLFLIHTP